MTFDCSKISLKKGSKGEQVKEAQTLLKQYGYYKYNLDGEYGDLTVQAVQSFQKALNITVDGWIGKETCNKLQNNQTISADKKKGSKGDQVTIIQNKLQTLGLYTATIDGEYGDKTVTAVKTFQSRKGLATDGIVGKVTYKALMETQSLKTSLLQRFEKATKSTVNDYKSLYNAFKKGVKYVLYYNDIYTLEQEITRVEKGQALNCTDQAQLGMNLLLDLGYKKEQIRIVRGIVYCKYDKAYGHVWLQLNTGNGWFNYDLSAGSAHGYNIGKTICVNRAPKITNIDPAWALSDDGKT